MLHWPALCSAPAFWWGGGEGGYFGALAATSCSTQPPPEARIQHTTNLVGHHDVITPSVISLHYFDCHRTISWMPSLPGKSSRHPGAATLNVDTCQYGSA